MIFEKKGITTLEPTIRVTIFNPEAPNREYRQEPLSNEDLEIIHSALESRSVTNFSAILYPVRTHSFKPFVADLFLPATMHAALRINNVVLKTIAIIAALFLDIVTLPIRLVTAIPRFIYNGAQPNSPLTELLLRHRAPDEVFTSGHVVVRLRMSEASVSEEVTFSTNLLPHPWYPGCQDTAVTRRV